MSDPPGERRRPARQLVFDLARDPSFDPDEFLVSSCNEAAYAAITAWPVWPDRVLLLLGPPGAGKSHLAAIWSALSSAVSPKSSTIAIAESFEGETTAVLEDCDRVALDEAVLFHRLNIVRETGGWLLMTARTPPDRWDLRTPDLLSRLRLAPTVTIGRPDVVLMKSVMVKLFADRQIAIDEDIITYAVRNCEQSLDAVRSFVAAIDEASLTHGRRITRPLAVVTLADLNGTGDICAFDGADP